VKISLTTPRLAQQSPNVALLRLIHGTSGIPSFLEGLTD
jgi:hypothetical protein